MDWTQQARQIFEVPRPAHFTDYRHCCECAEHDQTLLAHDRDSIGLEQLGHPSWDPLCFSSVEGLLYYMPAMVRLTWETMDSPRESYLDQMLFHLILDGDGNRLVNACSREQRRFVAAFLEHLVNEYSARIEEYGCSHEVLRAHEIWSANVL